MKDAFTAALSDVVQHQAELASTLESLLSHTTTLGASHSDADGIRSMLAHLNAQVNALAKNLAAQHDQNVELSDHLSYTDNPDT